MAQNRDDFNSELSSEQVLSMTTETLMEHFNLVVEGYKFTTQDIWHVIVAASASGQAIESAANQLKDAPDSTTVRHYLSRQRLDKHTCEELETVCNQTLLTHLPPRLLGGQHQVAIDLTYIPYHGEAASDKNEIRRGQAKQGTTHFHCYATAYVIKKNKRVTLAVRYVQAEETMEAIVNWFLARLSQLGVRIKRLYLDKQFYSVPVITHLQTHHPQLSAIIPVIIRGKSGGTKALLEGRRSYYTTYTMQSKEYGQATFRVAVVCKYSKGRYQRRGIAWFAYVLLGPVVMPLHQIYQAYRYRFGIESTYRLLNQVRARTSSRNPKLRLLYVGIALALVNIWVYLKWSYLGLPRRGGRKVFGLRFPLSLFKQFLLEAIKTIYRAVCSVSLPKPPLFPLKP